MENFNSIKYLNLIKRQIVVQSISDDNSNTIKYYLQNPDENFRVYPKKRLNLVFNDGESNLIYQGVYLDGNTIQFIDDLSLTALVPGSVLNIFETFSISQDNELVTMQDINEKLVSEGMDMTAFDGQINLDYFGKSGLLGSFDKEKLNNLSIFVEEQSPRVINNNIFQEILRVKTSNLSKRHIYRLQITSESGHIFDTDIRFNSLQQIIFDVNHCSFNSTNSFELRCIKYEYDGSPNENYIGIEFRLTNDIELIDDGTGDETFVPVPVELKFGYAVPNIEVLLFPESSSILTTETLIFNIDDVPGESFLVDRNLLSASQNYVTRIATQAEIADSTALETDVVSLVDAGAIKVGDLLSVGTNFNTFVRRLLLKVFYPTFINPTLNLIINHALNAEIGTKFIPTLTSTFNRGQIHGRMIAGPNGLQWSPTTEQDKRSGDANKHIINGTEIISNNLVETLDLEEFTIGEGQNLWEATVNYDDGPQPFDSEDNDYLVPLLASTISDTVIINGYRKLFHGCDVYSAIPYETSEEVRSLENSILNPSNGTTFTINIPSGAEKVVFAYPSNLRNVTTVKYVEGLNVEVKGIFNLDYFVVTGANEISPEEYKIYTYVPVSRFAVPATYIVTI